MVAEQEETGNINKQRWLLVGAAALVLVILTWRMVDTPPPAVDDSPVPTAEDIFAAELAASLNDITDPELREKIQFFEEVAFGTEYDDTDPVIRKWEDNINIRVEGSPTPDDLIALKATMDEINALQDAIQLQLSFFESNVIIKFVPESTFKQELTQYQPVNEGFFQAFWIDNVIYRAVVLIDSSDASTSIRSSLIREELTQAQGLMNDSHDHALSLFNDFQGFVPEYAPIDRQLIQMLYQPDIKPGMSRLEARAVLLSTLPEAASGEAVE